MGSSSSSPKRSLQTRLRNVDWQAFMNHQTLLVTLMCLVAAGCSTSSAGGGSHLADASEIVADASPSADAAIATACGTANQPSAPTCPSAPGGICYRGTCDTNALPTGQSCTGSVCSMSIDPCGNLMVNGDTDYYACDCFQGRWVCGLCAPGGSICVDAGSGGSD